MAIELLIMQVRDLKADIDKVNSQNYDEKVFDRLEAHRILGAHGKRLSESRFSQLKNEGNVEELESPKRKS